MATIFISYQRESSDDLARYIHDKLVDRGLDVFLDVEDINGGRFEQIISQEIEFCEHFVVILTPTTLESEWVRREVQLALQLDRNIIPVTTDDFNFYQPLPDDVAELSDHGAIPFSHDAPTDFLKRLYRAVGAGPESVVQIPSDTEATAAKGVSQDISEPARSAKRHQSEKVGLRLEIKIALLGLAIALLALIGDSIGLVDQLTPEKPDPSVAYLFLVDTSENMQGEVNGIQRIEFAKSAIEQVDRAPLNTNRVWRGMRLMGGGSECNESNMAISGRNLREGEILQPLEGLIPGGTNAYEFGINRSFEDFDEGDPYSSDIKIVFIILGSVNLSPCRDFDFGVALRSYRQVGITTTFCTFTLDEEAAKFDAFKQRLIDEGFACVFNAGDPSEIGEIAIGVMEQLVLVEKGEDIAELEYLQTPTPVVFLAATPTPPATNTPTPTATTQTEIAVVSTPSLMESPIPSNTPTDTPTPTNTPSPTDTPTDTPSPTNTPTNTPSPTDTPTDTPLPTNTPTDTLTPTPPGSPDFPVKLGVLSPITGPAASIGEEILNWQKLAVEDFNTRTEWEVEIVEGDTEIDPAVGVVAAEAIIADGDVYGATGPASSQVVAATINMFNEAGMVHVSASTTDPNLTADGGNGTFFRVVPTDADQGPTIGNYLADNLGATALFIIDDQSTYSVGLADVAGETFEESGGEIVGRESVTQDDIDFSALVTSIDSSGADAVFFPGQIASQGATLAQQLLEQGVDVILMGADGFQSQEDFIDAAAGATEGAYSTSFAPDVHELEAAADQVERYTEEYGEFTSFGPPAYVAATVVLEAMERVWEADGELSREAVAAEVANTNQGNSVLGIPINFAGNGDLEEGAFFIFRVEDGDFVPQTD